MSRRARPASQDGSTLLLGIGLLGICLLAFAVVADAGNAFLQHRQLYAIADAAALAGAQAIDLPTYYADGAQQSTRLEAAAVIGRVRAHVEGLRREVGLAQIHIDAIRTDGRSVMVQLSAPAHFAFADVLGAQVIRVQSTARLDYRQA